MIERGKLMVLILSAAVVIYVVVGGFLGRVVAKDETYQNISLFNDVLKKIQDEYVEKPQMKPLTENALKGLAGGVDSFSTYLNPDELSFVRASQDKKGGLGIVLSARVGYYRILQVLPSSPAEKAGLFPGDLIEEIDGQGVSEKSYPVTLAMLRGDAGQTVKLGLARGREEELHEVVVRLDVIQPPQPETRILEAGIGYIRLVDLHPAAADDFQRALNTLISSDVKQLVLDVRDCCGGEYESALRIADMLLDEGVITRRRGSSVEETPITATKDNTLFRGPLVVLANGFTSGPAEVLAAAIQDNARGTLVGQKTNGTASEQTFIDLADGSALYITHIRYHTPAGRPIMNTKANLAGVKPGIKSPPADFAVSLYIDYEMATGQEAYPLYRKYIDTVYAKQLEKALEVLKQGETAEPVAA